VLAIREWRWNTLVTGTVQDDANCNDSVRFKLTVQGCASTRTFISSAVLFHFGQY
jgi:hypothetical protein